MSLLIAKILICGFKSPLDLHFPRISHGVTFVFQINLVCTQIS